MRDLKAHLANRRWHSDPPPDQDAFRRFLRIFPKPFPAGYLELIQHCDGGDGELALPPQWFVLDSVDHTIDTNRNDLYAFEFPHLFFFGGNGGLEMIAFDTQSDPWPVVMIDPIAGLSSVKVIAADFEAFLAQVGIPYPDDHDDTIDSEER
jgi:hypothetical protein